MADPEIIFTMKVKLPNPAAFHSSPSGDTEYENAHRDALFENKPVGFEIKYPRADCDWPKDKEGFTWVPLYLTDNKSSLAYFMNRYHEVNAQLLHIKRTLKDLVGGA